MSLKVFAGISLRTDVGVHFGTMVRIRTGMAGVQTDARYALGDRVEFQLELTGYEAVVHGVAEVVRAEHADDELSSYLLRIRKMRRGDQDLLQEWYEHQLAGGEPSLVNEGDARALDSQVESRLPSAVGANMPAPPAPRPSHGRAAIRALLLDAALHSIPSSDVGGAAADEPTVTLDSSPDPPLLDITYRTQGAWHRDCRAQLSRMLLFVQLPHGPLALDSPVRLRLQRPLDAAIECAARVVLLHDRGVGLSLDLDPSVLNAT